MLGIIGAMDVEINDLVSVMENVEEIKFNNLVFHKGMLSGKEIVVVKSGVGKVNAALCTQLLILKFNADKIINTGVAGAISEKLRVLDFVVSAKTVYHDADVTQWGYKKGQISGMPVFYEADEKMVKAAVSAFNKTEFSKNHKMLEGVIASGDQFISDKAVKERIKNDFDTLCCEMEGCAVAHTCYVHNVPFVIVRCLSDQAQDFELEKFAFNEKLAADTSAELIKNIIGTIED